MLVAKFVQSDSTVAIDSGDLCTALIQEIGDRLKDGTLSGVRMVPSCDAAASEAAFVGVPQVPSADLQEVSAFCSIDVCANDAPSNGQANQITDRCNNGFELYFETLWSRVA